MEDLEKRYEIKYKDGNIYIDRIGKIRCKEWLSEKIKVNQYRKVKLSNSIIFKIKIEEKVYVEHTRFVCRDCGKGFSEDSSAEIRRYFLERRRTVEEKILGVLYENKKLKHEHLNDREMEILGREKICYESKVVITREEKKMNQFDKKMTKTIIFDINDYKIMEIKYKNEKTKKDYVIIQED